MYGNFFPHKNYLVIFWLFLSLSKTQARAFFTPTAEISWPYLKSLMNNLSNILISQILGLPISNDFFLLWYTLGHIPEFIITRDHTACKIENSNNRNQKWKLLGFGVLVHIMGTAEKVDRAEQDLIDFAIKGPKLFPTEHRRSGR